MSHVPSGACPKCGAPIYTESPWFAVTPPPVIRSCGCFPQPEVVTTTTTNVTPYSQAAK